MLIEAFDELPNAREVFDAPSNIIDVSNRPMLICRPDTGTVVDLYVRTSHIADWVLHPAGGNIRHTSASRFVCRGFVEACFVRVTGSGQIYVSEANEV